MPPTPGRKSRTIDPRIAQPRPLQPGRHQRRRMGRAIVRAGDASCRLQTDPDAPAFDRDTELRPMQRHPLELVRSFPVNVTL